MSDSLSPPDLATPPYQPTETERAWLPHGAKRLTGESVRLMVVALRVNPQFRCEAARPEPPTWKAVPIKQAKYPARAPLPKVELFEKEPGK